MPPTTPPRPLAVLDGSGAPRRGQGRTPRPAAYTLRVSVLEQCQFNCAYCLPGAVTPYTPKPAWLKPADYETLAPLFFARGVRKVRLTGGEPLLRTDLVDIITALRRGAGRAADDATWALTTNGEGLAPLMRPLRDAGLQSVTVHLDTLRDERYGPLMGAKGRVSDILGALADARDVFDSVKVNAVAQRGKNDDELAAFMAYSARSGIEVRFIELMNTGSAGDYVSQTFLSGADIRGRLSQTGHVSPRGRDNPSDPAARYRYVPRDGSHGEVGFGLIASDTEPFCDDCDRLRLTADGRLRGCLYEAGGVPLGRMLRAGASAAQLSALLDTALDDKRSFHPLAARDRIPFSMADVGG